MKKKKLRLAFPLLGRGSWTGGLIYLKNTLRLIHSRLADEIEPFLFLSPNEQAAHGSELAELVEGRILTDPHLGVSGRGGSLFRSLVAGRDRALERILTGEGIDVAFENAGFYGARFAIPVVSWIPDLQHRHMPEMFNRLNWWRRDLGFKMQVRAGRTIMLSSQSALRDLQRFYPSSGDRAHVVRFAVDLEVLPYLARAREVRMAYNLPERYFFLPNQFWRHKNHGVIVRALACLKAEGQLNKVPPVILTGQPHDPRNPTYFEDLFREAKAADVDGHFRYLGLVPYDHVLCLNAGSHALINPSLFEGWSTPIEEAKAFATPLVLSDIPIHREQAPAAIFFDPASTDKTATALLEVGRRPDTSRPSANELTHAQNCRLDAHAAAFLSVVQAARSLTSSKAYTHEIRKKRGR